MSLPIYLKFTFSFECNFHYFRFLERFRLFIVEVEKSTNTGSDLTICSPYQLLQCPFRDDTGTKKPVYLENEHFNLQLCISTFLCWTLDISLKSFFTVQAVSYFFEIIHGRLFIAFSSSLKLKNHVKYQPYNYLLTLP